jgi:hypothetical protein
MQNHAGCKGNCKSSLNCSNCEKNWRWCISRCICWMRMVRLQRTTKILGRCSWQSSRDLNRAEPAYCVKQRGTSQSCEQSAAAGENAWVLCNWLQSTLAASKHRMLSHPELLVLPPVCIWVFRVISYEIDIIHLTALTGWFLSCKMHSTFCENGTEFCILKRCICEWFVRR